MSEKVKVFESDAMIVYEDGKILLRKVPTWYPQYAHAKSFQESPPKFGIHAFLDKKKHKKEIEYLEKMVAEAMVKGKKWSNVPNKNRCLLDGAEIDNVTEDDDLHDVYRLKFSATKDFAPAVRNAENKVLNRRIPEEMAEIEDSQQSGRICSILTKLYGWDNPTFKNAGVIMNLLAIRLSNSFTDKQFGSSGGDSGSEIDDDDWGDDFDEDDDF